MSDEINSIKTYRQELLNQCAPNITSIPQTGYSGIDAIISFMTKEAAADNINLKFNFDGTFFNSIYSTTNELDLVHLFSDLLENAIIATKCAHASSIELLKRLLLTNYFLSESDIKKC